MLNKIIRYFLENRVITILILVLVVIWGLSTSPFNWHGGIIPRNPIPVDAIPDIGDNQQIVATEWMGRSPKDIQDQITYPLTASLLGIPGVKSIRSSSMFGMSFIYIIFDDNIEFYWSRSRILEKLNSLPPGTLPEGVQPALGPDATALGQIYWYTLEGRDPATGKPTGGWNAEELRTLQDYYVKYSLSAAEGVSGSGISRRIRERVPGRTESGSHACLQCFRHGHYERHQEKQSRHRRRDNGNQQGRIPDPRPGLH